MNSITLEYSSQRQLERKVKAIMLQWGYTVTPPRHKFTKMIDFRRELGIPATTLCEILNHPDCPDFPGNHAIRRQRIVVTPALRQFVKSRIKSPDCNGQSA